MRDAPRSHGLRALPERIDRWLIPPAIRARGREAVVRSRAILAVVLLGLPLGLAFAWRDFHGGAPLIAFTLLGFLAAGAAIPFLLRRTASLPLTGNLLVGLLFLLTFTPGLLTLGRGPGVLFLFLVPALAVIFCGRRAALAWSLLAAAAILALAVLSISPWAPLVTLPAAGPRLHWIAFVSLLVAAGSLLTYDVIKDAALRDLERANAALGESREQYRELVETSPDAVFVTREGRLLYLNSRAVELVGAASERELLGRSGSEFIEMPPGELERFRGEIAAGRRVEGVRMVVRTLRGERLAVESNASPTLFEGKPAILSVARDRSEEERTLARLRLLGTVVDQAHEGVLVVDAGGVVRYANDGYAAARGLIAEAIIGRPVTELPPDDAARSFVHGLRSNLATNGGVLGGRYHFDGPGGRKSWDIRIFPVEIGDPRGPVSVTLIRDVSREVDLEEAARQSQKMEAVGQLAGGIAHDFNNHLTVILGHAEELRAALPAESTGIGEAEAIIAAVERSAALTQQLLAFARRQAVDVRVLDLAAVVRGMQDMLRRLLPERIELSVESAGDEPAVLADRGQVEQVVLNLLLNARDAIEGNGRIRIETRAGPWADDLEAEPPERCAILRVVDDGHGMDEGVRSRIFEPFFTTKPAGLGTGLGLSTVHGIVHQSGGAIEVESQPGRGTWVAVYLPEAEPAALAALPEPPAPLRTPLRTGSVLLVEDDASVRSLSRRALEAAGFQVVEAEGGAEALRLAAIRAPDVVVSDVVMPGMSGLELAERLAVSQPHVPVLFVSGYAEDAPESRPLRSSGRDWLGKPFRPQQLVERVRQLLEARSGPGVAIDGGP